MTMEQGVTILLVLLVLLFNFVAPRLRRQVQNAAGAQAEPVVPPVVVLKRTPPAPAGPPPSRVRELIPVLPKQTARRRGSQALTLRDARRGLVLMAILGPCRANDTSGRG